MKKTFFNCLKFFDKTCPNSNDELFLICRNQPKIESAVSKNGKVNPDAIDYDAIDEMNDRICKNCDQFIQRSK